LPLRCSRGGPGQESALVNRWRVYCLALAPIPGTHIFCDWPGGYRKADTQADAEEKACPRCGGPVTAFEAGRFYDRRG
jgi:hypothetical protein